MWQTFDLFADFHQESFYREAIAEYAKRLTRFCKFNVVEVAESKLEGNEINKVIVNEGKCIISKLKGYVIVLDLAVHIKTNFTFELAL